MKKFSEIITAMVTPMKDDLSVDYESAQELALWLLENGSQGVVVSGTTGESPTLAREEKINLFKAVKEAVGNKGAVIAGTGNYCTWESKELTMEAEKIGVDGALLVGPYYNKPTQKGFYEHFKEVANQTGLPLIIYNIPGRTGKNIDAQTIIELSKIENIVGVKEASGDLEQVSCIVKEADDDFMVYSGEDFLTLPIVALGGDGVISVASHLAGAKMKEMIEAFHQGQVKEALRIHHELMPLYKVLFITTNPTPIKAALNLIGKNVGHPRLPLLPATPLEDNKIKEVLEDMGLI